MILPLNAVMLGVVQGVTEWLPISSRGQTILIMLNFLKMNPEEALSFSVWLHLGTVLAALIYFRNDFLEILKCLPSYIKKPSFSKNKIISFLIVSTLMTGLIGYPLYLIGKTMNLYNGEILMALIGVFLICSGLLQRFAKGLQTKSAGDLNKRDSIILGLVQSFSAIPGFSRTGLTTSALLLRDYEAKEALRISFLMSVPAVLCAELGLAVVEGVKVDSSSVLLGVIVSFVVGLISIDLLIKIAQRIKFWRFCILIGALSLIPLFLG